MLLDGPRSAGVDHRYGDLVIPALVDYGGVIALSSRIPRPGALLILPPCLSMIRGEWI